MIELFAQDKEDGVKEIEELCDKIQLGEANHVHLLLTSVILRRCNKVEQFTTTTRQAEEPDEEEQVSSRHANVVEDEHRFQ